MADLPDKGQKNAQAAYDAAKAGQFQMPEDGAKRLAASCDKLVAGLQEAIRLAGPMTRVTGFPDLPSGQALTNGFSAKAHECLDALAAFQESALRYKAAYLAAGQKFDDADQANQAAIQRAAEYLEDQQ
jgi:hypothetical protein